MIESVDSNAAFTKEHVGTGIRRTGRAVRGRGRPGRPTDVQGRGRQFLIDGRRTSGRGTSEFGKFNGRPGRGRPGTSEFQKLTDLPDESVADIKKILLSSITKTFFSK